MNRIGVREFRDHATRYLSGDEVLAIERYGRLIGFFIPTTDHRPDSRLQALDRLEQTVERVLDETGLTEDELSRLFDLHQPLPEQPTARRG